MRDGGMHDGGGVGGGVGCDAGAGGGSRKEVVWDG